MRVRARAPLRISFGGGGTDVPPYCDERGGAVLSATINRHAYATLIPGGDSFDVKSLDYDASIRYGIDQSFAYDGQLDLVKGTLDYFREVATFREGLQIVLHNDAPPGSGLGSSSGITVALVCALAKHLGLDLDGQAIGEAAYQIERVRVGQIGGKQDQFASACGGFNFIEFREGKSIVNALRLGPAVLNELEYRLVFAYVGGDRVFSHILERQVANYREKKGSAVEAMDMLKELAYRMKDALLLNDLGQFGVLLHEAWQAKKAMAEGITNPHIDALYDLAREHGAQGGKITGAGGGGFMFFFCDPFRRHELQEALREAGVTLVSLSFIEQGAQAWTVE